MLPVLPRAPRAAALQSRTALPELGQPRAWTSKAAASLLSSVEDITDCWGGFYAVCEESRALARCLPDPAGRDLGFPQDLSGRKGGLSHSLCQGHVWGWG